MKNFLPALALVFTALLTQPVMAATPEQEKAFIDAYKKAFESKDEKTLKSFFYTEGADPDMVEMLSAITTMGMGAKITSIELVPMTDDEIKAIMEPQDFPNGKKVKINLKPYKQLIIKTKDANGATATVTSLVAEKDGKLVIPFMMEVK